MNPRVTSGPYIFGSKPRSRGDEPPEEDFDDESDIKTPLTRG